MAGRTREVFKLSPAGGGALVGDITFTTKPGTFALISCHGLGSKRGGEKAQALAEACARRDWTFVEFDFRGHGQSGLTLTEMRGSTLMADIDAVIEDLNQKGVTTIGLIGSSMGGWAAAWYLIANPRAAAACVLAAPALKFLERRWERLSAQEQRQWRDTGRMRFLSDWVDAELGFGLMEEREQFRFEELAAAWRTPLLIHHGLADKVVSAADSIEFAQLTDYPEVELRLYKTGDHRLTKLKDVVAEATCQFFEPFAG